MKSFREKLLGWMFSPVSRRTRVLGCAFVGLMLLAFYVEFVNVANTVGSLDSVESLSLSDGHGRAVSVFGMGDVLTLSAKIRRGNAYALDIYDESTRVLSLDGRVESPETVVRVPVASPVFEPRKVYSAVFRAGFEDYPLPGVSVFGSSMAVFSVVQSLTKLSFVAVYGGGVQVEMRARLLTSSAVSVFNKTVEFALRPNTDLPDAGWVNLGSVETDENGTALFYVGVDMMGGHHGLRARFLGDDDFGPSSNTTSFVVRPKVPRVRVVKIERLSDRVNFVLRVTDAYNFPIVGKLLSFEATNLQNSLVWAFSDQTGYARVSFKVSKSLAAIDSKITLSADDYFSSLQTASRFSVTKTQILSEPAAQDVSPSGGETVGSAVGAQSFGAASLESINVASSPNPAFADLHVKILASFWSTTYFPGTVFSFYKNGVILNGTVGATVRRQKVVDDEGQWYYYYNYWATLLWYPDSAGSFFFKVNATSGGQLRATGQCPVFPVQKAKSNIRVYYADAFVGSTLRLTVAVGKARTYDSSQGSSSYFSSFSLAPTLLWDSTTYILANKTSSMVQVYVNGTLVSPVSGLLVNSEGVGSVVYPLDPWLQQVLNVTVYHNASSRYEESKVSRLFSFSQVLVSEKPFGGGDKFKLNYTLDVLDDEKTYINLDNQVKIQASFNLTDSGQSVFPLYNVSASVVAARAGAKSATNASGFVTIPSGFNYLRVRSACILESGMASPLADVYKDQKVDANDTAHVAAGYGAAFGDAKYDWHLDLNGDYVIDQTDVNITTGNFGRHITYLDVGGYDYRNVWVASNQNPVQTDSRGFVRIPSGALWLQLWDPGRSAHIGGIVEFFDIASEVQVSTNNVGVASTVWNSPQVGVYVLQVKLPQPDFISTVAVRTSTWAVDAATNLANYYYLVKRPVSLSINPPTVETVNAEADATVENGQNYGHESWLRLKRSSDQHQTYVRFNVSSIPTDAYVVSARMSLYGQSFSHPGIDSIFEVHRVTQAWSEYSVQYANREPVSSCDFTIKSWLFELWPRRLLFDITEDVRVWVSDPEDNYGLVIVPKPPYTAAYLTASSREGPAPPTLEVTYLSPSSNVVVNAYDSVLSQPVSSLGLYFRRDGVIWYQACTNASGVALTNWNWQPENALYNISVSSFDTSTYASSSSSTIYDFRQPSNLTFLEQNPVTINVWDTHEFRFRLTSYSLVDFVGEWVKFVWNGTSVNGTVSSGDSSDLTDFDGVASFSWLPPGQVAGTYSVRAMYEDDTDLDQRPSESVVTVKVNATPLGVLFSIVAQGDIQKNTPITLNATIIDPATNQRYQLPPNSQMTVRFMSNNSDGVVSNIADFPLSYPASPVFTTSGLTYPSDGKAYAYMAKIVAGTGIVPQGIVGNPVQLTVGMATRLLLNVTRDNKSSTHTIEGWLKYGSAPVINRTISIRVNETMYSYSVQTDSQGHFVKVLGLQAVNNTETPYMISASFEGDVAVTATASAKTLDGTAYPACTTIQYNDYKPSSNSTLLWVEPQSTPEITPTTPPEQIAKEWVQVWPVFFWWYPWFRLYAKVSYSIDGLNLWMYMGMSPFLPDPEGVVEMSDDLIALFSSLQEEVVTEFWIELGAFIVMYFSARGLSLLGRAAQPWLLPIAVGIMAVKFGLQAVFLWRDYDNKVRMLGASLINAILAVLTRFKIDVVLRLIGLIASGMSLYVGSALEWVGQQIKAVLGTVNEAFGEFRDFIDQMEFIGDVVLAALAWKRFFEL